jgi:hypothetical protein
VSKVFQGPRRSTFRVLEDAGGWRVSLNDQPYGDFATRGDAVRAACLGARSAEGLGDKAQVLAAPGDERVPHHEPHFAE